MELLSATTFPEIEEQPKEMLLSQLLSGGPMGLAEALRCGYQIATALRQIHENQSFFGNLQPSSIMVTAFGTVTIMQETASLGGIAAEASPYTAPEQLEGKSGDCRIDIFAFGAVLYEMLTGKKAFDGPWQPAPEVRSDVARLIRTCLEKNPEKRYSNVRKLLVELKLSLISIKVADQRRRKGDLVRRTELAGLDERMSLLEDAFSATTQQMQCASDAAANVCAALARLEENINHRLESHEAAADELSRRVDENGAELHQISGACNTGLESVQALLGTVNEVLSARIGGLEEAMLSQNDSIKLLETSCSQIDHLMERTLETLDGLVEVVPE